jgi:hypothetical protein
MRTLELEQQQGLAYIAKTASRKKISLGSEQCLCRFQRTPPHVMLILVDFKTSPYTDKFAAFMRWLVTVSISCDYRLNITMA